MFREGTKKLTPVMKQYRDAKRAYPDAILFFRLGDFYEMFNDDAVIAARELSLTLTSRNKGSPEAVPMAGVPYHSAHNYLAKLIARGHKVAICEQMGDPSKIKGIVPRKVVRVLTPGLLTDSDQLDARSNNFLCAVDGDPEDAGFGLSRLDLSTGELSACELASLPLLVAEVARNEPAELLLPKSLASLKEAVGEVLTRTAVRDDLPLEEAELPRLLDEGIAAPLYAEASRQHPPRAVRAAARALRFARHYLPEATIPVRRIGRYDPGAALHIDETAQQHLELVRSAEGGRAGSLLDAIDATVTAPGARLLRRRLLAPLVDVEAIRRRHDAVELFLTNPRARDELREALARMGDIERLAIRASLREATPRDLGSLAASLGAVPAAIAAIQSVAQLDRAIDLAVDPLEPLAALLARALVDDPPAQAREGGIFRAGYDEALDAIGALKRSGAELVADLEARRREETQIGSLKVKFTRAFGWYIEVTRAHLDKVPASWRRRQTLTGAERYVDDELEDLADKLIGAEERYAEREAELFDALIEEVAGHGEALEAVARAVADWDVAAALAQIAHEHDFRRPAVDDGRRLELGDARHPVVERFVPTGRFVPNDTLLDLDGERLWLITGPNMAGKSTLMRQVALNVILAQMGSFVPAARAQIGVVDRVLSRVGASDNLARGESTFMVEMRETATILRDATPRSLVILDEIGRGTSTFDGLAIAWAVAEYLHTAVGCRALFATHYHQLTELSDLHPGIANYSVSAREHEGEVVFLHRLTKGAVSKSYGIAVAKLAGLPEVVVARARAILASLEGGATTSEAPGPPARSSSPQLDLFATAASGPSKAEAEALATLRAIDVAATTPLDALALLDRLKRSL